MLCICCMCHSNILQYEAFVKFMELSCYLNGEKTCV